MKEQDAIGKAQMMTIPDVADRLKCSERHLTNLRKRNEMPQPVKLGALVRWPRAQIEEWIDAGCPAIAV